MNKKIWDDRVLEEDLLCMIEAWSLQVNDGSFKLDAFTDQVANLIASHRLLQVQVMHQEATIKRALMLVNALKEEGA